MPAGRHFHLNEIFIKCLLDDRHCGREARDTKTNKIWFLLSEGSDTSKEREKKIIQCDSNCSWQGGRKVESGAGPLKMSRTLPGKQE